MVAVGGQQDHEGQSYVELNEQYAKLMVPASKLSEVVRRPMAKETAEALLKRLASKEGQADPRPWSVRYTDHMRALVRGNSDQQAEALHGLYLSPYRASFGELKLNDDDRRCLAERAGSCAFEPEDDR